MLEFNHSPWLKQCIDFNTQKRTNAKNSSEKDFFKLVNNSVFGKTMENIRKRVNVRLVTDKNKLLKLALNHLCIVKNIQRKSSSSAQEQRNTNLKQAGICKYVYPRSQ